MQNTPKEVTDIGTRDGFTTLNRSADPSCRERQETDGEQKGDGGHETNTKESLRIKREEVAWTE